MPRIFDNIEKSLLPALQETLEVAERADFCVGYFNLRGWRHLANYADRWVGNDEQCCRLLVGMHVNPSEELRRVLRMTEDELGLDNQTAIREKRRIAEDFRQQLTFGVPTNEDEAALRQLAHKIRAGKLIVKVYLRHPLHAKLYLLFRQDPINPIVGYLGSSNLTLAGLSHQSTLPDFVQTGMKDAKARMFDKRYNLGEAFHTASGERGTLPTETWREYVERRNRCLAVREKLAGGEIKSADDLITLNLDIRQFMQYVIDTCAGPDLLRAVWQAIVGRMPEKANEKFRHGIAILDPTCGSGAFLFAALNVLEPLYEACLDRMEAFVEDAHRANPRRLWLRGRKNPFIRGFLG